MNIRLGRPLVVMLAAGSLSGCLAMAASGLMGGAFMDTLMSAQDASMEKGWQKMPDLGSPGWNEKVAQLRQAHNAAQTSALKSGPGICKLDQNTAWLVAHGLSMQESRTLFQLQATSAKLPTMQAVLLEGRCVNGKPDGDFTAVAWDEGNPSFVRQTTGTMRNGRPVGEWITLSGSIGKPPTVSVLRPFADGRRGRYELTVVSDPPGKPATSTFLFTRKTPAQYLNRQWLGDEIRVATMVNVNRVPNGWSTNFESDKPGTIKMHCYQNGVQVAVSVCSANSPAPQRAEFMLPPPINSPRLLPLGP